MRLQLGVGGSKVERGPAGAGKLFALCNGGKSVRVDDQVHSFGSILSNFRTLRKRLLASFLYSLFAGVWH